jgi:hypothetical protein
LKTRRNIFVFGLLALLLTVMPSQKVMAASLADTSGGISVVAVTGDSDFLSTTVEPEALAGIQTVADAVYPAGFVAKEVQFIGNAVTITGHSYGEAKACFTFPTSRQGWVGNVYQWDGTTWHKLTTSLVPAGEGAPSACASFYGNGDLALIGAYTGPNEKAHSSQLPKCYDRETEVVPEGYITAWPFPSMIELGDGYAVIGVQFFTFSGTAMDTVVEHDVPVSARITVASPNDVVQIVKGNGSGTSSEVGLTDVLLKYKLIKDEPYTLKFTVTVNGKCQMEYDLGSSW